MNQHIDAVVLRLIKQRLARFMAAGFERICRASAEEPSTAG
jgi:hypothetical protein